MRGRFALPVTLLLSVAPAFAHRGMPADADTGPPPFKLERLTARTYCLTGQGGNVGFLVTDEGVLVVDDQYERLAQGIVDQIRSVTDKPIRYLINTHYHADHTGGNPIFIKLAEIIAHDNVRPRLLQQPATVARTFPARVAALQQEIAGIADTSDPYRVMLEKDLGLAKFFLDDALKFKLETAAPPGLTYEGRVTLWLGGQTIEVFHVAPGHTDGDSIVLFKEENVLHMGDLFFHGMYPFIDDTGGGSVKGYIESIDYALSRATPDTKVIPGHGPVSGIAELRRARDFLADLWSEVDKAVKAGMSKPEAVRTIKMEAYPEIKPLFRALGNDVAVIYDEIKKPRW